MALDLTYSTFRIVAVSVLVIIFIITAISVLYDYLKPKKKILCNKCGEKIEKDSPYCKNCGAKNKPTEKEENVCTKCGNKLTKEDEFCPECGRKIK